MNTDGDEEFLAPPTHTVESPSLDSTFFSNLTHETFYAI